MERQKQLKRNDIHDVFSHIYQGGMPQAYFGDDEQRQEYFNSYVDTYLMRDITEAGGITDYVRFKKLLVESMLSKQYSVLPTVSVPPR